MLILVVFPIFTLSLIDNGLLGMGKNKAWEQKDADEFKANPELFRNKLSKEILTEVANSKDLSIYENFPLQLYTRLCKFLFVLSDKTDVSNPEKVVAEIRAKTLGAQRFVIIILAMITDIARKDSDGFFKRADMDQWINLVEFFKRTANEILSRLDDTTKASKILVACLNILSDPLAEYLSNIDQTKFSSGQISKLLVLFKDVTVFTTFGGTTTLDFNVDRKYIKDQLNTNTSLNELNALFGSKNTDLNKFVPLLKNFIGINEGETTSELKLDKNDLLISWTKMRLAFYLVGNDFKKIIARANEPVATDDVKLCQDFVLNFLIFIIQNQNTIESKITDKASLRSIFNNVLISMLTHCFGEQDLKNLNDIKQKPQNITEVLPKVVFYISEKNLTECMLHDISIAQAKVFAVIAGMSLVSVAINSAAGVIPGIGTFVSNIVSNFSQTAMGNLSNLVIDAMSYEYKDFQISGQDFVSFLTQPNVTKVQLKQKLDDTKEIFEKLSKATEPLILKDSESIKRFRNASNKFLTRKWWGSRDLTEEEIKRVPDIKAKEVAKKIKKETLEKVKPLGKKKGLQEPSPQPIEIDELTKRVESLENRVKLLESKLP